MRERVNFFATVSFHTSKSSTNMPRMQLTRDQRRDCQLLRSIGWRYKQIQEKTGFSQHQIQYACTSPATPTKQSGHLPTLTQAQIEDLIGYVCMSARNRRLSFQQLAEELDLGVGRWAIRTALVFVTGPPGPRNRRAPASIPRPAPVNGPGRGVFFLTPAPAPVQAPAPFNAQNSPLSMNFLRPGPRFFVYSPLEHCSFDT